jgi:hypothetical protein
MPFFSHWQFIKARTPGEALEKPKAEPSFFTPAQSPFLSFFACLAENPGVLLPCAEGFVERVDEPAVAI